MSLLPSLYDIKLNCLVFEERTGPDAYLFNEYTTPRFRPNRSDRNRTTRHTSADADDFMPKMKRTLFFSSPWEAHLWALKRGIDFIPCVCPVEQIRLEVPTPGSPAYMCAEFVGSDSDSALLESMTLAIKTSIADK